MERIQRWSERKVRQHFFLRFHGEKEIKIVALGKRLCFSDVLIKQSLINGKGMIFGVLFVRLTSQF